MTEDEAERARVDALMARPMRRIREVARMEGVTLGYAGASKEAAARQVASTERYWRHVGHEFVEVMA